MHRLYRMNNTKIRNTIPKIIKKFGIQFREIAFLDGLLLRIMCGKM